MVLKFVPVPKVFKDMPMWGCRKGDFTFVISSWGEDGGIYKASAKKLGALPFDGTTNDLGQFATFTEAERACNDFYRKRNN